VGVGFQYFVGDDGPIQIPGAGACSGWTGSSIGPAHGAVDCFARPLITFTYCLDRRQFGSATDSSVLASGGRVRTRMGNLGLLVNHVID